MYSKYICKVYCIHAYYSLYHYIDKKIGYKLINIIFQVIYRKVRKIIEKNLKLKKILIEFFMTEISFQLFFNSIFIIFMNYLYKYIYLHFTYN